MLTIFESEVRGEDTFKLNDPPTSYPEGFKSVVYITTEIEGEILISCGGNIISPRTVLTSMHCMLLKYETHMYVFAGSQNISPSLPFEQSDVSGGQIRKVTKRMVHEKFRIESDYNYDVALVSFEEELTFGESLSFIELRWMWARLEEPVYFFSWKHSASDDKLNVQLRWGNTSMACRSKGKDLAKPGAWDNLNIYTDGVLFVKDTTESASICYGDAGSPLVQGGTQIGIASFGVDYDCKGLNAISGIRRHFRWILRHKAILEGQNVTEKKEQTSRSQYTSRKRIMEVVSFEEVLGNRNSPASSSAEARIKNGTRVESPETFPFMAAPAIYFTDDPAKYNHSICGGSILTQWIILTAAHCVAHNLSLIVYAGIVDQSNFTEEDQAIKIKDYRVPPKYNYWRPSRRDIALILLSSPLKLNSRVAPVCQLAMKDPPEGTPLQIAGWGYLGDENQTLPSFLSVTKLIALYKPDINAGEIRFNVSATSACLRDSGSPYFNEDHEVVGVQSHAWPGSQVKTCNFTYVVAMSNAWYYNWTMEALQELEALVEE